MKISDKIWNQMQFKSLDVIICNLNLNRLTIVLFVLFLFQILNFFNPNIFGYKPTAIAAVILMSFCFLAMLVTLYLRIAKTITLKIKYFTYMFIWSALPLLMIMFYLKDIRADYLPFNFFITVITIAAFPVINLYETALLIISPMIINGILMVIYPVHTSYIIYVVATVILGALISYSTHGTYMDLLTQLSSMCTYDPLTKLLNKNAGYQRAINMYEICKRLNQPFCVYMLDIDFFKSYNDTYGHPAGDIILREFAKCIQETFARKQDIVSRYGGEEFLICCTNRDPNDFEYMAETLLDNIHQMRLDTGNKSISPYLTASIGYVYFTEDDKKTGSVASLDELIRQADQALYKAKAAGRNQFYRG